MTFTVLKNFDLSHQNTMSLSSVASVAVQIDTLDDICDALAYTKSTALPVFILSGGSNVLLPSQLDACVILPRFTGINHQNYDDNHVLVEVSAGENWHEFIQTCLKNGWYGLENLALIPGLAGACPIQNIGAYGVQVSDFIYKINAYEIDTAKQIEFLPSDCQFAYRHSIFKDNPNKWLITSVVFKLHLDKTKTQTNYGDLANLSREIAKTNHRTAPTPDDVFDAVVAIRSQKLPDPSVLPNCGSFFQNPVISMQKYNALKESYPELPSYPIDGQSVKVPAGWLIDKAGLKGAGIAPILTHKNQALVLTNHAPHKATQNEILLAQNFIIKTVQDKFDITLVREPVWVDKHGQTS